MKSYQDLLKYVIEHGEPHADRTGVGTTSVFGAQWRHNLKEGFPLLTTKRVPMRWVATELEWFLKGRSDNQWLKERGVDIWDEWATEEKCAQFGRKAGDLGPVYGPMWREFPDEDGNTDQIVELIEDIENTPNSRRLIVTGWHPYWQRLVSLPPCHTLWQVKCHADSGMSLHLYARSIDIFLGMPFDIASYGLLLELLAFRTGRHARELIVSFGDLHLYDNHKKQADELLSREPRPLPKLKVNSVGNDLREFQCELVGYDPHPKIEAEVAV